MVNCISNPKVNTSKEKDNVASVLLLCLQSQCSGWQGLVTGVFVGAEGSQGGDWVVIGSFPVSASWFCWGAPSSSSGASSSCSCKAPVFRQPMKGIWKLSIARLPFRPHPWESVSRSPVVASPQLPAMYSWLFLSAFLTIGHKGLCVKVFLSIPCTFSM